MHPTKKLGEICEKITDGTHQTPTYFEKGVIFLSSKNVTTGKIDWKNVKYIDEKQHIEMSKRISPKKGDILLAKNGTTGVGAIVEKDEIFDIYVSLALLRPKKIVLSTFLWYFINSSLAKNQFNSRLKGVGVPNLHLKEIKEVEIPLPPLPTQQKIVEKLDTVLEKIEKNIELTKQNLANIEEQNKSILEKMFRECEEGFEMKELGKISENIQYGYTGKTTESGKIKYLRITDIQDNAISWERVPFVDITAKEITKYSLNEGDIVFARTGATVGKSCLIDKEGVGNVFASYLIRVIPDKNIINPLFLKYFFLSDAYWQQLLSEVVGSAQPNFNGTKLKSIQIPLPSLPKQQEIVNYLDSIFEKNSKLKNLYEKNLKNLEELKQSVLKEAFENEDFIQ